MAAVGQTDAAPRATERWQAQPWPSSMSTGFSVRDETDGMDVLGEF